MLRVHVQLAYTEPLIWRRLDLASDLRLDGVHVALQIAFEWHNSHLHEFRAADGRRWDDDRFGESSADPERKMTLGQLLTQPGEQLLYTYDFGDSWEHVLTVEEVLEPSPDQPPALLLDGERAAPPEDCGGIPGYDELLALVADPASADAEELEWAGEVLGADPAEFDPSFIDLPKVQAALKRAAG